MNDPVKVAVVGATGYAGFELARLLLRHPQIEKPTFYLRDAHANVRCLTELYPQLRGWGEAPCKPLSVEAIAQSGARRRVSFDASRSISGAGARALSGESVVAHRGSERRVSLSTSPELLRSGTSLLHPMLRYFREAVYGLPELYADPLPKARLVANPGCYPTSVILGAAASSGCRLDQHGARNCVRLQIRRQRRGQRTQARNAFRGSARKFRAYGLFSHRHTPEVEEHTGLGAQRLRLQPRTCCRWSAGFSLPIRVARPRAQGGRS